MIGRYRITGDGYWPCRVGTFHPLRHPRRRSKYHFAMILQDWARERWTPDVVIKRDRGTT